MLHDRILSEQISKYVAIATVKRRRVWQKRLAR